MTDPLQLVLLDPYAIERAYENALRSILIPAAERTPCIKHSDRHGETIWDHPDLVESTVLIDHLMPIIGAYIETHYQPRSPTA